MADKTFGKYIALTLAFALLANISFAQYASDKEIFTYHLESHIPKSNLRDTVPILVDSTGQWNIHNIFRAESSLFKVNDPTKYPNQIEAVWSRVKLINNSDSSLSRYFMFCNLADSVWFYLVDSNGITEMKFSGTSLKPNMKSLPAAYNFLPFYIPKKDSIVCYFKFHFKPKTKNSHFSHIYIEDSTPLHHKLINRFSMQSLYSGILILFCLVSLFMFFSFKERIFIYFALLMISFVVYFLGRYGILETYILYKYSISNASVVQWSIVGITVFTSLFLIRYVKLREVFPKYFKFYIVLAIVTIISPKVSLLGVGLRLSGLVHNYFLITWILATMIPVIILSLKKDKSAQILLLSLVTLFLGSLFFVFGLLQIIPESGFTRGGIQVGTIFFSGFLFYGLFDKINTIQNEKLVAHTEREKSDEILHNILPAEIANELKEYGKAEAKRFEEATILFTDFKGFTQTSENLTARELVDELNTVFKAFDTICMKWNIEKIKTIGDAYMAAGGIPVPDKSAPANVVSAALEMAEFIINRKNVLAKEGKVGFSMRVGIHTGPVVAGIVGLNKFQYDIWGDAVNTASRMESSGEVDKVNISSKTYLLIKDNKKFTFQSRGKIAAKGKGDLEMWFVSTARS